ncbi:hypothetical protein JCM33374_g1898 [Metschnikowia sp. JCM 33374]|nr:hypothetical protein JCM33374_g1898 [Metschnikowia sp. JCM 33374]
MKVSLFLLTTVIFSLVGAHSPARARIPEEAQNSSSEMITGNYQPKETSQNTGEIASLATNESLIVDDPMIQVKHRKITLSLERFIRSLKSFLHETGFSVENFESAAEKLEAQLSGISQTVLWQSIVEPSISSRLEFAENMFASMVDSIELLKHYDFFGGADFVLVNSVIELNVRLFEFFDSFGVADPSVEDYANRVTRFGRILNSWGDDFEALSNVSIGVRYMFKEQFSMAEAVIQDLVGKIPK